MTSRSLLLIELLIILSLSACCKSDQIPRYIRDLRSSNAKVKNEAALELANCGSPKADAAVSDLIRLLYDPNVGVQSSAAYALRRIATPEAEKALQRAENASLRDGK